MNSGDYDVAIIGAGPAGCSCALALANSGLRTCLLDKALFPREKVCGDSIPGYALIQLEHISPGFMDRLFKAVPYRSFIQSALVFPKGKTTTFDWKVPGYQIKRKDFDYQLIQEVKRNTDAEVCEGLKVNGLEYLSDRVFIHVMNSSTREDFTFTSKVVIGADGAFSKTASQLLDVKPNRKIYGQAIRTYYTGIEGVDYPMIFVEPKDFMGYFWIFPMSDGITNVGFGILEPARRESGYSIVDLYKRFIEKHPKVNVLLRQAKMNTSLKGAMVPFANQMQKIHGDRVILAGDAASLVDPFSGDGVQFAVKSGVIAAAVVHKAFKINRFDEHSLSAYTHQVEQAFLNSLLKKHKVIKLLIQYPWLVGLGLFLLPNKTAPGFINRWI